MKLPSHSLEELCFGTMTYKNEAGTKSACGILFTKGIEMLHSVMYEVFMMPALLCRVGLASGVGEDFPASCKEWLDTAGVDTSGLVLWPHQTLRAWQVRCTP